LPSDYTDVQLPANYQFIPSAAQWARGPNFETLPWMSPASPPNRFAA
jgi:hypothetical protein